MTSGEPALLLALLVSHGQEVLTRVVNRLRGTPLSMFPALERALDMANTGPLRLLTGCQTPHAIRRAGVTRLAMALNEHVVELDKLIEDRFREHELADIVLSVPGIGTTLGAEFLAAVGGSLDRFDFPDALAAFADVAAVKAHGRIDVCSLFPPAPTV